MSRALTILTGSQVDKIISKLDLEAALTSQAQVFKAFSAQTGSGTAASPPIQTPLRSKITSSSATSLFMPSRVAAIDTTACKIVSIPQGGSQDGLPGTTVVLDSEGNTRGIVNARKLTALRNAAVDSNYSLYPGSALFLRACPLPQPPTTLVIFGSGAQALSHATLFLGLWPSITQCTFVNRRKTTRADELVNAVQTSFSSVNVGLHISEGESDSQRDTSTGKSKTDSLETVVSSADIIVTVTPSYNPLFPCSYVSPNTRLILVGSYTPQMHEIDTDLVNRAGIIVVDSKEACGHEAGELIDAGIKEDGLVEIGELLSQGGSVVDKVGGQDGVKIFKSVGIGIQDVAIAKLVLDQAEMLGVGTQIENWD